MRPRLKDPMDIAVATLAKAKGISLIDAARIIDGAQATQQSQQSEQEKQTPSESVDSVTARLEELEELEAEALDAIDMPTASQHRKEANKLRNQLMDLKIAEVQSKAIAKANADQNEAARFTAEFIEDRDKYLVLYPAAKSAFDGEGAKTPFAEAIIKMNAEWEANGDPLFNNPKKAGFLMKNVAAQLGIPLLKAGSTPAQKSVQHRPTLTASGNARTATTDSSKRTSDVIEGLKNSEDFANFARSL